MSDTPVAPLPPSYDWGFVVGRSISAMADTVEDPDRFPEARGSNGRVTFTPHTRYKKELSAPTAFVQFEVITARIENGNVVDAQGENGIYLISGAYKVAFTIDSGSIPGFDILVTPDHTLENPLDLVTASPFVPEDNTPVTTAIIPAGAAEGQVIAWRNGRLVWVNGSVQAEAAAARAEAAATAAEEWKPEFTWSDTNLVIDGVPGPSLKGEKGDGSSWDELTGKPAELEYNSGWRVLVSWDASGTLVGSWTFPTGLAPTPGSSGSVRIRRVGARVEWLFYGCSWSVVAVLFQTQIPDGFRTGDTEWIEPVAVGLTPADFGTFRRRTWGFYINDASGKTTHTTYGMHFGYETNESIPATLPGDPA